MTDNWHTFLDGQGAQRDEYGVLCFEGTGACDNHLVALDHLGFLLVSGPEARKFLQGQVTCDMQLVREDHSQPGAHCNTKGRMVFSFRAVALPSDSPDAETIALIMHRGLLETAKQALQKYIVFSKATLSIGEGYRLLGLAGARVAEIIGDDLPSLPIANHDLVNGERMLALRVGGDRLLCLVKTEAAQDLWRQWAARCQLEGYLYWNLCDIRDGIGQVLPGTGDMFIPQMLNMQVTGGVSFNKGCYIGQEVVARMQYLGKLKRHMRRFRFDGSDVELEPGLPLYSPGSGQSVGNVVLAAPADGGSELLAVTTDAAFEQNALYLDEGHTQGLAALPLPYVVG